MLLRDGQYEYELHPQVIRDLTYIAMKGNMGYFAAINQAIIDENFLGTLEDSGATLLIELPNGTIRRLEREPQPR